MATSDVRRSVELPDGRRLTVRPALASDVDGLAALSERLDPEDRHRRFFSAYQPPRRFLERFTAAGRRGGAGLVAVVHEDIVGEAGYSVLPNGDGELGITVAEPWRGWLGPFLLDALLETAREHGVPNLEADILVTNGPMLAIARARGAVHMAHDDMAVVRVVMGTDGATPTWPAVEDGHRTRVLVEGPGGHWLTDGDGAKGRLEVLVCPGAVGRRRPCPMAVGRPCPLAAEADAIVITHPTDSRWRGLVDAHRSLHPGVPVCLGNADELSVGHVTKGPGGDPDRSAPS